MPIRPTDMFRKLFGDNFFYILYFQEPGVADAELNADSGAAIRKIIAAASGEAFAGRSIDMSKMFEPTSAADGKGLLDRIPDVRPGWMTQAEADVFVSEYTRTGFTGGLNYYRNFDRNWELLEPVAKAKVKMPAAFITGSNDVGAFIPMPGDEWVPDLRLNATIDGAGHWLHQQCPEEVNRLLVAFLAGIERDGEKWQ
jgi:pimeloyl-ACP methyl ester carboxylesterase